MVDPQHARSRVAGKLAFHARVRLAHELFRRRLQIGNAPQPVVRVEHADLLRLDHQFILRQTARRVDLRIVAAPLQADAAHPQSAGGLEQPEPDAQVPRVPGERN
jgi:hypothetical protein